MLRLPLALVSALLGMIVVVSLAYALPENPGAGGGGIPKKAPTRSIPLTALIGNRQVQNELNLSDEQNEKIGELQEESRRELDKLRQGLDPEAFRKKLQAMYPKVMEKEEKHLTEILKPEQMERLKQISLQLQGADILRKPEVVRTLGLSIEQQEKLSSLFKQADKQRADMINQPPGLPIGQFGGMMPMQNKQALLEKALKLLTPEQRQKVEKIVGKPIDLMPPGGPIQLQGPKGNN
jgi:hypothetical protein